MTDQPYLKNITVADFVAGLLALQHFFENLGLLLHLGHFLCSLGPIIRFVPRIVAGHDLHKSVCFLQVLRPSSPNEFL
jgi:hypothetical protein